jgi:hypothetical protein
LVPAAIAVAEVRSVNWNLNSRLVSFVH